jgi:2-iminobutanoate/2-iminopropanoate deaminase
MKKIITSPNAPAPIGPYNQATEFNGLVFISGQIALKPDTGELVTETIELETRQALTNLRAILIEAGLGMDNILKCSIFVKDMNQYSRINAVYGEFFNDDTAPARELVEVANLPKFVNIEISAIAARD